MSDSREGVVEKTRRSQRERRETTMAKLVEATIESLLEVGYAATSVKEVCRRSGISHGGLFRHYPAMLDLIIAAAEEVARRQIAEFEKRFWGGGSEVEPTLPEAMRKLRDACRSPVNAVWYELMVAARTDEPLRRALEAPIQRYYEAICATAKRVPGIEAIPPELFETMLFTLVHVFDGESLVRTVRADPVLEERRMDLLLGLIALLQSARA